VSDDNLEIVRRQFELWNEGDLDAAIAHYHPDVVMIAPEGWPEGPRTDGADAWRRQAERLRDTWGRARVEIDELRAIGDERVVARIRYLTEGADKAISFDTPMGAMFVIEAGRITRGEYSWSFDQALEAAEQ
jgi:ketosteroid isomerase-like protein